MPNVVILGSTGSIGTQTLDVIQHLPGYHVLGLSAGSNYKLLRNQIAKYQPKAAGILDKERAAQLSSEFNIPVYDDEEGLAELAAHPDCDIVVVAIVGAAGLKPTLAALQAGKRVALANKETLVTGGHLVMKYKEQLIPVDSEHSALWHCFHGRDKQQVADIVLTASGGPFREYSGSLHDVTIEQALNHPRWNMGGKISIDSATLMNKGLEVIEAHWLFGFPYNRIEVVVHPESIVHSLIRLNDGSMIAELGTTDMRIPIQYALTYPEVLSSPVKHLDLTAMGGLSFEKVKSDRFPCLELAYTAGESGGEMPIALNAANEIAVYAFMNGEIGFMDIPDAVSHVMQDFTGKSFPTLEQILEVDAAARNKARDWIRRQKLLR